MVDAVLKGEEARGQRHQDLRQQGQGRPVLPAQVGDRQQGQLQAGPDRLRLLHRTPTSSSHRAGCGLAFGRGRTRTRAPHAAGVRLSNSQQELTMDDHILEMRGITKTFPGVKALQDVTLAVSRGEIHAICGENGAGKSTLMKVLSGVYPHGTYDGDIVFEGEPCDFADIRDSETARHRHHPPGAGAEPVPVDRREHLPRQRARPPRGLIDWNQTNLRGGQAARPGRPAARTRSPRSWTSASASSSSSRSPRRCPRT